LRPDLEGTSDLLGALAHADDAVASAHLLERRRIEADAVVDDGVGFDPASLEQMSGRHGIVGMRERAEEIGGALEVRSQPGKGTEIVVVLP